MNKSARWKASFFGKEDIWTDHSKELRSTQCQNILEEEAARPT